MSINKGRTAFFLALSIVAITVSACESSERHEGTAPVVITSPSPITTITPTTSPTGSPSAPLTAYDQDFLTKAARGNLLEVRMGNLAAQKASSNDVKQFGQRMVTDHTKAGEQLNQLASTLNFTPPQELSPEQQSEIGHLEKASGKDFDREFMKMMVSDHTKDISAFERAAAQSTNPDVKQFATNLLPTLNEHAKMAREIAAKVGAKVPAGH
jgi:putative membrane protein